MKKKNSKSDLFIDQYTKEELDEIRKRLDSPETRALHQLIEKVLSGTATPEEQALFDEKTKEAREYRTSKPFYITAD